MPGFNYNKDVCLFAHWSARQKLNRISLV